MRILMVGAGALGSYIGARLLASGQDVTFLVRQRRASQLKEVGLQLDSLLGNCRIPAVRYVLANAINRPFDLVIVTCKAYGLDDALISFAPAVGPDTAILPLLNGIDHIDILVNAFGSGHVLGGQCMLAVKLSSAGRVRHLNDTQMLTLGELDGTLSPRVDVLATLFGAAGFQHVATRTSRLEMWEKCAFIASAMCTVILTRLDVKSPVKRVDCVPISAILKEFSALAAAEGFVLRPRAMAHARVMLDTVDGFLTQLILDDLQCQLKTETNHILSDLVRRAQYFVLSVPWLQEAIEYLARYRSFRSSTKFP